METRLLQNIITRIGTASP